MLPFAEKAFIDDQKLANYCLSETHTVGKHKARVFKSALGITAVDYPFLRETILTAVLMNEAQLNGSNQQGTLYSVDFRMTYENQTAIVRTAWIVRYGESFPRLVSCYIKP